MKRRSAADFIRIVKREIKKEPKAPVRLDVYPDEIEAIRETFEALNAKNRKKVPWGWTYRQHPTTESMLRVAFYGPDIQRAFKVIETQLGWRNDDDEAAVNKERQRLREEYPGCRVVFVIDGPPNHFHVWRGEDYLFATRAPLNGLEASDESDRVMQALHDAMKASDKYEPLAKKETNRRIAQATAENNHRPPLRVDGKVLTDYLPRFIELRKEHGSESLAGQKLSEELPGAWTGDTIRKKLGPLSRKR